MPKIVNHDEYRKRILEKSFSLFTSKGYTNITMDEIAAEIGTSKGVLYHYFPSKVKMLYEMISWISLENTEEYIKRTSSVEKVGDRFDIIVDFWKEKGKLYENILLLAFDMYRNTDIETWMPLYDLFAERYIAGMAERLNISRQFARAIFIYFLGLSFHSISTGSNTNEYNKQIDFLKVIFKPLIVDAPEDIDKAAEEFKAIYKIFLANLPVISKNVVNKKVKNIKKQINSLKGSRQKRIISNNRKNQKKGKTV